MFNRRSVAAANPARVDRDDEKRMLPCRYFIGGFCSKGPRCKFYHPNLNIRDPYIRVPDLPSNFSMIPQPQGGRMRGDMSFHFDRMESKTRSRSRIAHGGYRGQSNFASAHSPQTRSRHRDFVGRGGSSTHLSELPPSQRLDYMVEEADDSSGSGPSSPDGKPQQNTIFNHIDWSKFLAPGVAPPVPTAVPDQGSAMSPIRPPVEFDSLIYRRNRPPFANITLDDMPPEGSSCSGRQTPTGSSSVDKKLSAKQELQMKVKQIAQEMATEPGSSHEECLDNFFRSLTFSGYNLQSSSSALPSPRTLEDLRINNASDKENSRQATPRASPRPRDTSLDEDDDAQEDIGKHM